jgi:hypothetical protein
VILLGPWALFVFVFVNSFISVCFVRSFMITAQQKYNRYRSYCYASSEHLPVSVQRIVSCLPYR